MENHDPDANQHTSYASFGIISAVQDHRVYVIMLEGIKEERVSLQLPGGGGLGGETPERTLKREVVFEIMAGEKGNEVQPSWGSIKLYRTLSCTGDPDKGGGTHFKHFYHVGFKCPPELRNWDQKPEADGTFLGRPRMLDLGSILPDLRTKRVHRQILGEMLWEVMERSDEIKVQYMALLQDLIRQKLWLAPDSFSK